jgi:hypothetical protein
MLRLPAQRKARKASALTKKAPRQEPVLARRVRARRLARALARKAAATLATLAAAQDPAVRVVSVMAAPAARVERKA